MFKKNNIKLNYKLESHGFTILEVVFVLVILSLSTLTIFSLFNLTLKMTWENKARIGATQLANKKLEIARNLPYDDVGTVGGIVSGNIPETEIVTLNNIDYTVYTNVVYVDDPFDGTFESDPIDTLTNDYKMVSVKVSWDSEFSTSPVEFYTNIAPKGVESNLGGGTLVIKVFNASGLAVDNANIHIYSDVVSPTVDMNTYSNAQGQLVLPGVLAADTAYEITVTKSGYSTAQTYDTTVSLPTPDKPHLTVFEGQTTSASFAIDQTANMTINVVDINDVALGNITLNIQGAKRKGLDGEGDPVYKFDEDDVSNASGVISLTNIEWDDYTITIDASSGYDINQTDPIMPVAILPLDNTTVTVKLEPTADHSLLAIVKDINDQPVEGASVNVTNVDGYDKTIITSSAGQAFFTPLTEATTTITVTKAGYDNYTNEFMVSGYTYEPVIMSIP